MDMRSSGKAEPTTEPALARTEASYDAFLSYSHRDRAAAIGLQKGLHSVGRGFAQRRALRVFRDATDLTASPDLWGWVTAAMDASRYMVVLLSPFAAASAWVNREIEHWLDTRGPDCLLLVVAHGTLVWDGARGCFDEDQSTASPRVLARPGALQTQPFYVDISGDAPFDAKSPVFREKVTDLAAPIHGKEKSALAGDDLREQRRMRRLRNAAVTALVLLTTSSLVATAFAIAQTREARHQRDQALAVSLAVQSREAVANNPALAVALAAESIQRAPNSMPQTMSAMLGARSALAARVGQPIGEPITGHAGPVRHLVFSPDGTMLASASGEGGLRLWDPTNLTALGDVHAGLPELDTLEDLGFSPDGAMIAATTNTTAGSDPSSSSVVLVDSSTGSTILDFASLGLIPDASRPVFAEVAFQPEGDVLVAADTAGTVWLWSLAPPGKSIRLLTSSYADRTGTEVVLDDFALSPKGDRVAVAQRYAGPALDEDADPYHAVVLWDTEAGRIVGDAPGGEPDVREIGLTGHSSPVTSVAFSPRGDLMATGDSGGVLRIWSAEDGEPLTGPLAEHTAEVDALAFSPDGAALLSVDTNGEMRRWDPASGRQLGPPLAGGATATVLDVAFTPDGTRIAAAGGDGAIRVWDVRTGAPTANALGGHVGAVAAVDFSPDGKTLVSGGTDGTIRLWDMSPQAGLAVKAADHEAAVSELIFTPDEQVLVSVDEDGMLNYSDTQTGRTFAEALTGHLSPVTDLSHSPDEDLVASVERDGMVQFWAASQSDSPVQRMPSAIRRVPPVVRVGPSAGILDSAEQRQVVFDDEEEGTVGIRDLAAGEQRSETLIAGTGFSLPDVSLSRSGSFLAATDATGVRIWNTNTGEIVSEMVLEQDESPPWEATFAPDDQQVAISWGHGRVLLWDWQPNQVVAEFNPGYLKATFTKVAFTPDGSVLAIATPDAMDSTDDTSDVVLRRWNTVTGEQLGRPTSVLGSAELQRVENHRVARLLFSPDGEMLVMGLADGTVSYIDAGTGGLQHETSFGAAGYESRIDAATSRPQDKMPLSATGYDFSFSPDGSMLVAVGYGVVEIWDLDSGMFTSAQLPGRHLSVAFPPDSQLLVTAGEDGVARWWDARSFRLLRDSNPSHSDSSETEILGTPDGRLFLSTDVAENRLLRSGGLVAMAFDSSGERLVTADTRGGLAVWETDGLPELGQPAEAALEFSGAGQVTTFAFSPAEDLLATGTRRGVTQLWHLNGGERVGELLVGHDASLAALSFSPSGRLLASGDSAGDIRITSRPWSLEGVCGLIEPYVSMASVRDYLPQGTDPYCATFSLVDSTTEASGLAGAAKCRRSAPKDGRPTDPPPRVPQLMGT